MQIMNIFERTENEADGPIEYPSNLIIHFSSVFISLNEHSGELTICDF